MSQPQPGPYYPPPPQSKKWSKGTIIAVVIAVVVIAVLVVGLGGYAGIQIYRASLQPNIQATNINIPRGIADPRTSTVSDAGRVVNSWTFDYTTSLPGTYTLVWDNSFSVFTSKSVSVTYTASGSTHGQSFTVQPGNTEQLMFNLGTGIRIYGNFAVFGGSNDVNFYITAQTCTQTVNFSFTLVNSGASNGYATVQFMVDGQAAWTNRYYVTQGQQVGENGSVALSDCSGHVENLVVSQQEKA